MEMEDPRRRVAGGLGVDEVSWASMNLHRSAALAACCVLFFFTPTWSQNSGKKIRPEPSAKAALAGMQVKWRESLEAALAEAKTTGKPVFWYVPTVAGSFMDRRTELDRYMLAGPFSWPRTIALLNEHYIPVRHVATREERKAFALEMIEFIEPGYLVLDGTGGELARQDRITTFHPGWFLGPLAARAGVEGAPGGFPGTANEALAARLIEGRFTETVPADAEAMFLHGVGLFRTGRGKKAFAAWEQLLAKFPDHPLAAKVAMEMEGHGPLVHGFEIYGPLPAEALVPSGRGTLVAAGVYDENELWGRSLDYLVAMQRASGGFEDSIYDFGGTDGLPNVYTAVTAIIATGLLEHGAQLTQPDARLEKILAGALAYLADEGNVNVQDTDEQVWAHLYRARCLSRWLALRPANAKEVRPVLERIARALVDMQGQRGSWYHEYPNPFVTASCLIALHGIAGAGIEVAGAKEAVAAGTEALLRCRSEELAYSYGESRRGRVRAQIEFSVGRTPVGELALALSTAGKDGDLEKAVALSFAHEKHLLPIRKYDDHTSSFAYGGFFFWYDMHARVEAMAALPAGEVRTAAVQRQRAQILGLPEIDGCFVDSHENGRCYGTGMALWCLAILDRLE